MDPNETLIILLALIGLPILLLMYIIMPKDKNCNDCQAELSPHRQKTYHSKLNGVEKEICKRCYTKRFGK
jgi:hypothetical protein